MKTFVLFDRKSGEILHTHVEAGDLHHGHAEVLKTLRPGREGAPVDVLEVDELAPGVSYRVDIKTKTLVAVDRGKAKGSGGAYVQPIDGDPLKARTVIVQVGKQTEKAP